MPRILQHSRGNEEGLEAEEPDQSLARSHASINTAASPDSVGLGASEDM